MENVAPSSRISASAPAANTWARAILKATPEFAPTSLSVLSGKVPAGLRGTLYRNGPGRLGRGSDTVGHWFDGDGGILAVTFTDAGVQGQYRFIQTEGYQAEAKANKLLYANYGMTEPGPIWKYWQRLFSPKGLMKNTGNTALLVLPDRLLALWEGGLPHGLDLDTLETFGLENFGVLPPNQPYSAHPQRDPNTGEIFNLGIDMRLRLNLYKSDRTGKLLKQAVHQVSKAPFVHSFVLAGPYLVFLISPVALNVLPVLGGWDSYANALQWRPERGTKIVVVDKETLELVSQGEADPWFQWHFGNGCVESDGSVRLDIVRFKDFTQTNEYLREVATGVTHTPAYGTLWQIRLNPQTAQIISTEQLVDRACEFPIVAPHQIGQPWEQTYIALQKPQAVVGREWFGAIAQFDYSTGTLTEVDLGEQCYGVEPIYATDGINPDQGWILTVVYNGIHDCSEVWVLDSSRLNQGPVCRLKLPEIAPISFHGTWRS